MVYLLKALSLEDLQALAQDAKSSQAKAKRIFVEAVAQCGTANCVKLLVQLLTPTSNPNVPKLTPMEEKFVRVNLALTAHPTEAAVAAVAASLKELPEEGDINIL